MGTSFSVTGLYLAWDELQKLKKHDLDIPVILYFPGDLENASTLRA